MPTRQHVAAVGLATALLAACATPPTLPASKTTPIPTLIPVTETSNFAIGTEAPVAVTLSLPSQTPSAQAGGVIYVQECAKCHGDDGKGAVPGARDFTDVDFVRGESPAIFFTTVSEGHGEMLAFKDRLSVNDRWNAVFYVWQFSTSAQAVAQGKDVFIANCAVCHGENGKGAVLGAADFTNLGSMVNNAPRDFYQIITQGKGSMPAWQSRLSQDERWAVIDFLRTFSYNSTLVETESPSVNPTATP